MGRTYLLDHMLRRTNARQATVEVTMHAGTAAMTLRTGLRLSRSMMTGTVLALNATIQTLNEDLQQTYRVRNVV